MAQGYGKAGAAVLAAPIAYIAITIMHKGFGLDWGPEFDAAVSALLNGVIVWFTPHDIVGGTDA